MNYRVAVCQFQPILKNRYANLQKIAFMLSKLEADLVVLPELATSGYVFANQQEVNDVSEDAFTGPTATLLKKLAVEKDTSYVIGFPEKTQEGVYNSAMLVNPDGSIHIYRKTHLFFEEKLYFQPGDTGFKVFEAKNGVKVGLMVCFDWQFPEAARTLALKGAHIICHPSNLVLPWCQQSMLTRSLENRVFSITCNRIGREVNGDKEIYFTGMSQVISTKGEILTRLSEDMEETAVVEIEPDLALDKQVTKYNDAFTDRRTEFYEM
jgi:predicted amidohydrolase